MSSLGNPAGPDSEVYYYIGKDGTGLGKNPVDYQDDFIGNWYSVFMQYRTRENCKNYPQKNVDFSGVLKELF